MHLVKAALLPLALFLLAVLIPPVLHAGEGCVACSEFDQLNTAIRDGRIGKDKALAEMRRLLPHLKEYYAASGALPVTRQEWHFPLDGYNLATAGNSGRDYVASGYDYFAGNRHGGHPSFDLFIRDRNRDTLDDRNGKPVSVLSLTGGVVVALATEWDKESPLRGGKYIWVYDPTEELLVYYAHNRDILVKPGDILRPGDRIATVGRTGLNAWKKRSPTHLHLTCLKINNGYPRPENIYRNLKRAGQGLGKMAPESAI